MRPWLWLRALLGHKEQSSTPREIGLASDELISQYQELQDEFTKNILELDGAWMSDESSLWDFHEGLTNEPFYVKIEERYHVDVRDIEKANIAAILQKIATAKG